MDAPRGIDFLFARHAAGRFDGMEDRETYRGTQSDFHTHVHDLPPQVCTDMCTHPGVKRRPSAGSARGLGGSTDRGSRGNNALQRSAGQKRLAHVHDLPPQMGGCYENGSAVQQKCKATVDYGPWEGPEGPPEVGFSEPADAVRQFIPPAAPPPPPPLAVSRRHAARVRIGFATLCALERSPGEAGGLFYRGRVWVCGGHCCRHTRAAGHGIGHLRSGRRGVEEKPAISTGSFMSTS